MKILSEGRQTEIEKTYDKFNKELPKFLDKLRSDIEDFTDDYYKDLPEKVIEYGMFSDLLITLSHLTGTSPISTAIAEAKEYVGRKGLKYFESTEAEKDWNEMLKK